MSYEDRGHTRLLQASDLTYRDGDRTRALKARDLTYSDGDRTRALKARDLTYSDGDQTRALKARDLTYSDGDRRRTLKAKELTYRDGDRRRMIDGDALMRPSPPINMEAYEFRTSSRKTYYHRTGVSVAKYPVAAWVDVSVQHCDRHDILVRAGVATNDKSRWILTLDVDTSSNCVMLVYVAYLEEELVNHRHRWFFDVSRSEPIKSDVD